MPNLQDGKNDSTLNKMKKNPMSQLYFVLFARAPTLDSHGTWNLITAKIKWFKHMFIVDINI